MDHQNQDRSPTPNNEPDQMVLYERPEPGPQMETVPSPIQRRRAMGYPRSPPLRSRPPSPNLYRLVPVQEDVGYASESTAESPDPVRPADTPRMFFPPRMDIFEHKTTPSPQYRDPSVEPDQLEVAETTQAQETPAQMPPETPLEQMMDTPRAMAQANTPLPHLTSANRFVRNLSEPPRQTSQQPQPPPPSQSVSPSLVKMESPDVLLLPAPTPRPVQQGDTTMSPPAPSGSTPKNSPASTNQPRRTTRGSLAAAAAAATSPEEPPRRATPEPGAPVQASITTWIITNDKTWLLPAAKLGVNLAQIVPADFNAPPWMKFTRAPIVWDGRTDAGECIAARNREGKVSKLTTECEGGKSGRNLVLIGAAAAKVSVNGRLVTPTPASSESVDAAEPSGSSPPEGTITAANANANATATTAATGPKELEGLHLLMDYKSDQKPTYSYALMTRFAILGSPYKSLSLAEIYIMLEAKFPWYARDDGKWRDSIRYNLSSNCWFVKTKRALHQPGVGNLWMVDEESAGGPKRPRKGRGKGSAFMDPDEEEDSGDEPGPSIISSMDGFATDSHPPAARNGTLMLTFDSKAKVPLDKEQGQRGITAHASHNLIPRIVTKQLVMNAVDQAFASPTDGKSQVDPREQVFQALNNMPFSLSNGSGGGDQYEEARASKSMAPKPVPVTRRTATREGTIRVQTAHENIQQPSASPKKTPAPPWLTSASNGNGEIADNDGIGSGRDEAESGEEEEERLTPEDYWGPQQDSHEAEEHQPNQSDHSRPNDVDMVDRSTSASMHPVERRPSTAPLDVSGLRSLSDVALGANRPRPAQSFSERARGSPDVLVRGKQLSPRVINGVLTNRRQANYLDADILFRTSTLAPKPPSGPPLPEDPANPVQPPNFAQYWNMARSGPPPGTASTSAGPSSQSARSRAIHQRQSSGSATIPRDSSASSAQRRPHLPKLAPAATSSSSTAGGELRFFIPTRGRHSPPLARSRPSTPNRVDPGPVTGSPYAPPPDSRKRKIVPQSPSRSSQVSTEARTVKVRRIEADTERRRRVNHINPAFATSGMGQASISSTYPAAPSGNDMGPPPNPSVPFRPASTGAQGFIGFTTPTTGKTFTTPVAGGSGFPSSSTSNSTAEPGPAFGKSGFMFRSGVGKTPLNSSSRDGFSGFGPQPAPSFRGTASTSGRTRPPGGNMEVDSDEDLSNGEGGQRSGRKRRSSSQMDMDGSDDEVRADQRRAAASQREADLYRGGPANTAGVFGQAAVRMGSSLSISVPVSSSRMDRTPNVAVDNLQVLSPTSASRDSPVLAPLARPDSRSSTDSPRLPSINALLRPSSASDPHAQDSLPPVQPHSQVPLQAPPISSRTTSLDSSRSPLSAPDSRHASSIVPPHAPSGPTRYYGFLVGSRHRSGQPMQCSKAYSGGNDDDLATLGYRTSDWRD